MPNWPEDPFPQHQVVPSVFRAQVWVPPAVIWETFSRTPLAPTPKTWTGVDCWLVVELLPNSPEDPLPQHQTVPSVFRAQVWLAPAVICLLPSYNVNWICPEALRLKLVKMVSAKELMVVDSKIGVKVIRPWS